MRRLAVLLAVLLTANLAMIGVTTFVLVPLAGAGAIPGGVTQFGRADGFNLLRSPLPVFFVNPNTPQPLDTRMRNIVRSELGQPPVAAVSAPAAAPTDAAPAPTTRAEAPSATGRPDGIAGQRGFRPNGDRTRTVDATTGAAPFTPQTNLALLTPFGLVRSGPAGAAMAVLALLTFLGLAFITAFLAPSRLGVLRARVALSWRHTLVLMVLGFLTLALSALLVMVLMTLVVGVVFTPVVGGLIAAATLLGLVAVLLSVGQGLRTRLGIAPSSPLADVAVGMLLLFPLSLIPLAGWVLVAAFASLGLGAVVATRFGGPHGWSLAPLTQGNTDGLS